MVLADDRATSAYRAVQTIGKTTGGGWIAGLDSRRYQPVRTSWLALPPTRAVATTAEPVPASVLRNMLGAQHGMFGLTTRVDAIGYS
ncbi:hypothetical protein GCM10023145_16350 [Angustibacter luteus]